MVVVEISLCSNFVVSTTIYMRKYDFAEYFHCSGFIDFGLSSRFENCSRLYVHFQALNPDDIHNKTHIACDILKIKHIKRLTNWDFQSLDIHKSLL